MQWGMRWRAATLTLAAGLPSCGSERFDHARPLADAEVPEAGAPRDCSSEAEEGSACDDRDACTPSSACRSGQCVGQRGFDDCTLADSEADFGHTQGEKGWYYGYWSAGLDPDGSYDSRHDFVAMVYCGEEAWMPEGRCGMANTAPDYRWTMNLAWGLQHPETRPQLELPVRRWVSDVSGPVRVAIAHKVSGTGGDGTRALLLVDGQEVWRHDASGGPSGAVEEELELTLEQGMQIEQLVHPIRSSADDMTYFSLTITGR
jgi:hypothetical protein